MLNWHQLTPLYVVYPLLPKLWNCPICLGCITLLIPPGMETGLTIPLFAAMCIIGMLEDIVIWLIFVVSMLTWGGIPIKGTPMFIGGTPTMLGIWCTAGIPYNPTVAAVVLICCWFEYSSFMLGWIGLSLWLIGLKLSRLISTGLFDHVVDLIDFYKNRKELIWFPRDKIITNTYISLISFPLKLGNTYFVTFCPYQKRINHLVTLKIYNNHTHFVGF